jgi:HD-like signal output (HDOD) protein
MPAIGRFKVHRKLGGEARGGVYVCVDPELQRPVSIKFVTPAAASAQQDPLAEARAISRIQHPNLVAVYDMGRHEGRPYLVFEYVQGELLSQRLQQSAHSTQQSLDIFTGVLSGVARVHSQGMIHGDLTTSNIIINAEGVPKIMDFGLAATAERNRMAEDSSAERQTGSQADVFALGAILYEMLTGQKPFGCAGREKEKIPAAPSSFNAELGQPLDALVLKALEQHPSARYRDAGEMLSALRRYRETEVEEDAPAAAGGTVEFLLRRMRHKRDFPVLSESIRTLNRLSVAREEDISRLSAVIIRDFALTNKILKVVNSAYYSRFAGKIGTVSRAIVVLGIKPIRSIAASLIFFEHLHDKARAVRLKDEIAAAVFSATLARQLAVDAGLEAVEESFLCAMLHNLGSILVTYYLDAESEEIERLVSQEGVAHEQAQKRVLGMNFEDIGIAVARQWNFPVEICRGMKRLDPEAPGDTRDNTVRMRLIAGFCNEAAVLVGAADVPPEQAVGDLLRRYRKGLGIGERRFTRLVAEARREFGQLSAGLSAIGSTPFLQRLGSAVEPTPDRQHDGDLSDANRLLSPEQGGVPAGGTAAVETGTGPGSPAAENILTQGLQEVSMMLLDDGVGLTQVFNVVLESLYRALAFQRVLLVLQDVNTRSYMARLGFGAGIDEFMQGFCFPGRYSNDVFHAVLKNNVDLHIDDVCDRKVQERIPDWYKALVPAGSFLLFPLVVNGRPLGLIYADHPTPQGISLGSGQLNLLKALRNQVVLAFRARG